MSGAEPRILLELRFAARAKELHGVREALRNAVSSEGRSDAWTQKLVSAVDEACQNVIRYAYRETQTGDVELRLERSDDRRGLGSGAPQDHWEVRGGKQTQVKHSGGSEGAPPGE